MKLLLITTDNYPEFGTTVGIFKKLIFDGGLKEKNIHIDVLSLKAEFEQLENEYCDGIQVFRTMSWQTIPFKKTLRNIRLVGLYNFVKCVLIKVFAKLKSLFLGNCPPLLSKERINVINRKLKEINADSYDFIIPIFGFYDSSAAVMKYNPKHAKLVLYQVDPCSTNWIRGKREFKKNVAFEKELYKKADAILTMPVIYKDIQHLITAETKDKFYPMELPLVSNPKVELNKNENINKIKCVFSGNIYYGIRDPLYTLKLFEKLIETKRVELHLVGVSIEELPTEFRESNIVCYGKVLASEAQETMNSADVLVNIGNLMNNQLPSKIFDYISLGKPIVNVCKNRDCPTLPYMEKYPLSLNLFEEQDLLESQIEKLVQFLEESRGKQLEFSEVEKLYETATPKYCADFIYQLLLKLKGEEKI